MKFDRQLRPATKTSCVVSYGSKTTPRWRTAAILKIDISPYLSEKSSDFHEILYTAANFELDERHVIKNEKVALDRLIIPTKTRRYNHTTTLLCGGPHIVSILIKIMLLKILWLFLWTHV